MGYPETLRALSLINPYGYEIGLGIKPLEFRSWDTKFRGLFLIHVSSSREFEADFDHYDYLTKEEIAIMRMSIIGFGTISDSFWSQQGNTFAHRITNPALFYNAIPTPGALKYWKPQGKRKAEQERAFEQAWNAIQTSDFERPDPDLIRESEIAYELEPISNEPTRVLVTPPPIS